MRLGSKGRYGSCVAGRQNCVIELLNKGYLSTLEIKGLYTKHYINSSVYFILQPYPFSIYFIFSPFYFYLSFLGFTYLLLLSIPSLSTRIVPLRFQAGGRRRRWNLGLVCFFLCNLCYLYSLVKMHCGVLFYLV